MKIKNSHNVLILQGDEVEGFKNLAPNHTHN